jgi:hypothetical protein
MGITRAGVAIARSRLSQDCELMREVITSWPGQNCWELCIDCKVLAVGKGEVAAELLGRVGFKDSLRVAALLIRETGRVVGVVVKRTVSHRLFV